MDFYLLQHDLYQLRIKVNLAGLSLVNSDVSQPN